MDSVTLVDLLCMLVNQRGPSPRSDLDVLRSVYERTHTRYMAVLVLFGLLTAALIGVFVAAAAEWKETKICILALVALVMLMLSVALLARRLNKLTRDYLDILKVYNLLGQYVRPGNPDDGMPSFG